MVPIHLECQDCGHEWRGKPLDERDESPRCGDCGSRDVEEVEAGPGFDPDAAVGGGEYDERASDLKEALRATPGVGEAGAEYAAYWFDRSVEGPDDLNDLLLEVSGVDAPVARRIVTSIYGGDGGDADAPAPFAVGDSDGAESADAGGTDTLDAIIRAKQAGLIDGDDGGADSAEVAEAVASTLEPALRQIQATLAEGEDSSQVQELREEIEDLRESRRRDEIEELREEISRIEGDTDSEIRRLQETRDMLESAPSVSAEAADSWSDTLHGVLDRLQSMRQQEEIWSPPDDDRKPDFEPPHVGRGGRGATAQAPRQRPAPGQQPAAARERATAATADGGHPDAGEQALAGGDGGAPGGEAVDSETAEKAREVRESLGIADEGGSES
jgi:hypothetical protein